jgi:hypothetical protein
MISRWLGTLIGLSILLQLTSGAISLDISERPPIAGDIERRFNGRFILTTNGDGTYVIYQRVERLSDILEDQDHICMMGSCYVAIDTLPSAVLSTAGNDQEHTEVVRRSFKVGQDAYERALRATASEKETARRIWREQVIRIGQCLRDKSAC